MAKLQTFRSEFNGSAVPSGWTQFTAGSATFTYGTTGAQVNFPATTSSSTDGDVSSISTFSLVDSYGVINVLSVSGSGATSTDCTFQLKTDANNKLQIQYEAGTLYAQKIVAGAQTNIANISYNAVSHAWWRIMELNNTIYWQTSPDGLAPWTNICTPQARPITITAISVLIAGTCFGVDSSPSPFKWRAFNILPAIARFNNHSLRPHAFSPGLTR